MSRVKKMDLFLKDYVRGQPKGNGKKERITKTSKKFNLTLWEAQGISTFYKQDDKKRKVCTGLPCALKRREKNISVSGANKNDSEAVSCLGFCDKAPVVQLEGKYYTEGEELEPIIDISTITGDKIEEFSDFLSKDGILAIHRALSEKNVLEIIESMEKINMRGLGGAGFPTYLKWKSILAAPTEGRYFVMNAHEGEPGTFKDRVIMDTMPFDVIESALLACVYIGAETGIIALKHEYRKEELRLKNALRTITEHLKSTEKDKKIPNIVIERIPGYYVTGEETALFEAIEGKRSEPRLRPPFPTESGLYGKPTLIDNVETMLQVLQIARDLYAKREAGLKEKTYCLTGDVEAPGAYRVNYGIKLSDLMSDYGFSSTEEVKAILPGGLSGGILPASAVDISLDFNSVAKAGAGLGTGSVIVLSNKRCMVDAVHAVESFFMNESCGKCIPCRLGTKELTGLLGRLSEGACTREEITDAEKTATAMITGSICGLGQAAGRMYLDAVKHFKHEMESHSDGKCPSGVCFKKEVVA